MPNNVIPRRKAGRNVTWSHKRGASAVKNPDASGKIIYDPEVADRDCLSAGISPCNYTEFIGYYQVTPME